MRFANPDVFQLLWLIPVIWIAAWALNKRTQRLLKSTFGDKIGPFLSASVSPARRRIRLILRLAVFACFVTALARPQLGQSLQEVKSRGVELVIAIDVSNSMLAEDVKPSRLMHAKAEISRLLDMLTGDKVGIVAFAGSAVLLSPLTTDKSALKMFIDSVSPESVQTQGTNFKKALDEAKSAFERGGTESDETRQVTKVILVASDGEDHEDEALEQARKLASDGTRIFALAFGTERGGPIPIRDERGFLRSYKRDKSGQNVVSRVKGDFLRELAQVGKGSFHHTSFGGQEARQIKQDLDKLEQAEFASSLATSYDEKFQIPLGIGIVLALIELLIAERKKGQGRIWKGRFEVAER